jgi:hypothetical protein
MPKRLLFLPALAMVIAIPAHGAAKYQVGGCLAKLPNFATIQAAVSGVPPFSTILVCPGVYPEQVTISQPLTLRGQVMFPLNTGRPAITVPGARGLKVNVTNIQGTQFAAQVLVANVNPIGAVDILGITIDGKNGNLGCSSNVQVAGVFYASGVSGDIEDITTQNQQDNGCGFGIWVENGAGPSQTISIAGNSAHDMDNTGIVALSDQNPPTLTATISANSVSGNNSTQGIAAQNVSGAIMKNVVTGGSVGIADVAFFPQQTPGIVIDSNTVADVQAGPGIGIVIREGTMAKSNNISNASTGFFLQGGSANPGPSLVNNTAENTNIAIEFNCTANTHLQGNTFNDSLVAFDNVPSGTTLPSAIYNNDKIQTGACP